MDPMRNPLAWLWWWATGLILTGLWLAGWLAGDQVRAAIAVV
jgi:hypothetical protein